MSNISVHLMNTVSSLIIITYATKIRESRIVASGTKRMLSINVKEIREYIHAPVKQTITNLHVKWEFHRKNNIKLAFSFRSSSFSPPLKCLLTQPKKKNYYTKNVETHKMEDGKTQIIMN